MLPRRPRLGCWRQAAATPRRRQSAASRWSSNTAIPTRSALRRDVAQRSGWMPEIQYEYDMKKVEADLVCISARIKKLER